MVEKHKDHLTTANIKTCNSVIILCSYDLHIVDHYIQEDIDKWILPYRLENIAHHLNMDFEHMGLL